MQCPRALARRGQCRAFSNAFLHWSVKAGGGLLVVDAALHARGIRLFTYF